MAATQIEQGLASLPVNGASPRPAAQSADVETRLLERRGQVRTLRRLLSTADALATVVVGSLLLLAGREVSAAMALAVALAAMAHVHGADSPRSIASLTAVARSTMTLTGLACVFVTLLGSQPVAQEIVLGAACMSPALILLRAVARIPALGSHLGFGQRRRLVVGDPQALESTAARRAPLVESGEVILVVTRADRSERDGAGFPEGADLRTQGTSRVEEREGPNGLVERVVRTALENRVERVTVLPGESWHQQHLRELSWLLEDTGIDMVIGTNLNGIAPHRADVVKQDGRLNIKVGSASPRGTQAFVKDILDRVVAAVLLLLASPVLLAIVAAVRLESSGPAIFRQTRVREGGSTFTMLKFRTMHVAAEAQLAALQELNMHGAEAQLFKMKNDPRITRVGHLLRKTSLDELPQLVNVLKGQMSLIGPRPALPVEVAKYDYVARRRLAVKPGMTGLWQVSGRSRLSWDESIGFDLDYVDNWSPATDAAIAVRTFRAVVTKDGAF